MLAASITLFYWIVLKREVLEKIKGQLPRVNERENRKRQYRTCW